MKDIYFDPAYGKLYESIEGGVCETFDYADANGAVRHMFIKRPVPCLVDGVQFYDIVTPYGYGGPVAAGEATPALIRGYYAAWDDYCRAQRVASEFIRFHLFDNTALRAAFPGETAHISDNVVLSLEPGLEDIWMQCAHKVRKNVKKAQSNGLRVSVEYDQAHVDAFMDIYYRTMARNDAKAYYYFEPGYFARLGQTLGGRFAYFHTWLEEKIIATELVLCSTRYAYSFLGGTLEEYYALRPNDLLKWEIIRWCKQTGRKAFVLGGGYHGEDGIYRYKKAFAPGPDVPFYVGRRIHDPAVYAALVDKRAAQGGFDPQSGYFPLYRA